MALHLRRATEADLPLLGELNHQLIRDEGHSNSMTVPQLEERMRDWLVGDYSAFLFENESGVVAYALYREEKDLIYLRHLFVQRHCRRQGHGKEVLNLLITQIWPEQKRVTVDVLTSNQSAVSFYKAVGFSDYCLTMEIPA